MGVVIAMALQGLISLDAGIALALGANIGTCATAGLAAVGKPREAVRVAVEPHLRLQGKPNDGEPALAEPENGQVRMDIPVCISCLIFSLIIFPLAPIFYSAWILEYS